MAKKNTTGPDVPAEQPAPARRARAAGPRRRPARPDPGVAEPGATPAASESLDRAADMSVGADSSDSTASREPSYGEIAEAAYQRYLQRGGGHGQDFEDWLEAERSLRTRR